MTNSNRKNAFSKSPLKSSSDEHQQATQQAASEITKRTNLTIGLKQHMAVKLLTDCLLKENGRKITMDKIYSEAVEDLLIKYFAEGQGRYMMENNEKYQIFKDFLEREGLGTIKEQH